MLEEEESLYLPLEGSPLLFEPIFAPLLASLSLVVG